MMKKFSTDEITTQTQIKSSLQRGIRAKIQDQIPEIEPILETIMPKKLPITAAKCPGHITILVIKGEPLFFQYREGPWIPSLRLLHKYPILLPKMQVDRGAIKHILRGSNIMCQGLTSKGGKISEVNNGDIVQITAEGKFHALAVGMMTMSSQEIMERNQDKCIENLHYLEDGLWMTRLLE